MPTPIQFKAPFYADSFYHFVSKSIDGILLFNEPKDYFVYRERFKQFTNSLLEIWSYAFLNNHTHHIVKIRSAELIKQELQQMPKEGLSNALSNLLESPFDEPLLETAVQRQMNSFLASYSNYYNNRYVRKGGLFQKPFKRIQIHDDSYLQQAIIYTNANCQKHNICNDFALYPYSSYEQIMLSDESYVACKEVINFFGGKEKFESAHKSQVSYYYQKGWPSSKLE